MFHVKGHEDVSEAFGFLGGNLYVLELASYEVGGLVDHDGGVGVSVAVITGDQDYGAHRHDFGVPVGENGSGTSPDDVVEAQAVVNGTTKGGEVDVNGLGVVEVFEVPDVPDGVAYGCFVDLVVEVNLASGKVNVFVRE